MQKRVAIYKRKLSPLDGSKLRPQSCAYLVWDTLQRGLALQVQPSGYRAFKFIYRHQGRSRWFHIGAADAIGLADARRMAATMMLEVLHGRDPAAERRAGRASITFGALAARYQQEFARKRNRSWAEAARLVGRYVTPQWGNLAAASISRSDVRTLFNGLSTRAPVLANLILANVSAIFSWSVKQELLTINPCIGIERNATQARERVLSDAEVALFWRAFGNAGLPGTALQILLLTGQRPGEVSHMCFEHLEAGWWNMPGAPDAATGWPGTKNGESHRVWLPTRVRELMAELDGESTGFVFSQPPDLATTMRDIVKRLGVPRLTPHDLRRTHGTTITGLGFGRDAMNRVQNHREGGISSVYDRHGYADENKRVMEAVAAKLIALAEGAVTANVVTLTTVPR
jgi:integrase